MTSQTFNAAIVMQEQLTPAQTAKLTPAEKIRVGLGGQLSDARRAEVTGNATSLQMPAMQKISIGVSGVDQERRALAYLRESALQLLNEKRYEEAGAAINEMVSIDPNSEFLTGLRAT